MIVTPEQLDDEMFNGDTDPDCEVCWGFGDVDFCTRCGKILTIDEESCCGPLGEAICICSLRDDDGS